MLLALAMAAIGDGMDAERLGRIVDKYGQNITRIAYMYLKDRQRAEDICQEVFIRAYQANKEFESEDYEKSWLLRVTINLCKDHIKSYWNKNIVFDNTEEGTPVRDIADVVEDQEQARILLDKVMELPEKYKTAIILFYYEEMNNAQIAEILDVPEATVRGRLKRARAKLLRKWKGVEGLGHAYN